MRHRFHAICPYFAMFPESFAADWIDRLSRAGDLVLDPFAGRGTAPFQALLMDRRSIGSDVNPVAYALTAAKLNPPSAASLHGRITRLENDYRPDEWVEPAKSTPEFFHVAFTTDTLFQLLYLRHRLRWARSNLDAMVASILLGCLHGESSRSPRYLSNQMPRTISTKPAYSLRYWARHGFVAPDRDVFALLHREAGYRYISPRPALTGTALKADVRELPRLLRGSEKPSLVVTSPPYLDVTSFEEDQWLRLWVLGGPPEPRRGIISPDDRHRSVDPYWRFIGDVWRALGAVLRPKSNVVIRIGTNSSNPDHIAARLAVTSIFAKRRITLVSQHASEIRRRQTESFRPGTSGCRIEVDCHFTVA